MGVTPATTTGNFSSSLTSERGESFKRLVNQPDYQKAGSMRAFIELASEAPDQYVFAEQAKARLRNADTPQADLPRIQSGTSGRARKLAELMTKTTTAGCSICARTGRV